MFEIAVAVTGVVIVLGAIWVISGFYSESKRQDRIEKALGETQNQLIKARGDLDRLISDPPKVKLEDMSTEWQAVGKILADWSYDPFMDLETPCCERIWRKTIGETSYEISISGTRECPRDFQLDCYDTTEDLDDSRFWQASFERYFEKPEDLVAFLKADLSPHLDCVRRGCEAITPPLPSKNPSPVGSDS